MGAPWLVLVAAIGTSSCGRIGFAPLAEDEATRSVDASVVKDGAGDAPADALADDSTAPGDASTVGDAGDAGDAITDSSPDASDAAVCAVSATVDYCATVPPLLAPPVIDGILDCGPALVAMTPVGWVGPPPLPPLPPGNSASLAVAWRPDGLYVFMAVTSPASFPADAADPIFYGAGVELFVDSDGIYPSAPSYDNPGAIQLVVAPPPAATTTSVRGESFRNAADLGPWASTRFAAYPSPTGFVFEGFVVAADLGIATWALAPGSAIGFDVAVDVSFTTATTTGPQGHRIGQYFLHVGTAPDGGSVPMPYGDPRSFCSPTLAPM